MPSRSTLVSLATLLILGRTAAAELRIKSVRFVEAPKNDRPDQVGPRVLLQAVLGGAVPGLRPKDMTVNVSEGALPVSITATKSVPFNASDEELALFLLVQGNVRFMGNAEAGIDGYYEEVKQVIDTVAAARPKATRIGLYVYGANVIEKAPMGPAANVSGELLGPASEYGNIIDKALQRGIEEALRVLSEEKGRRVLFIVGDGSDQIDDYAPKREIDRLKAASIEVYVLGGSPKEPSRTDRRRLEALGRLGALRYANQKEQLVQVAAFLMNEINNVYTVEFPDLQASDSQMLPVDGGEHDVVIRAGTDESATLTLPFPGPLGCLVGFEIKCVCSGKPPRLGPPCAETDSPGQPWWLWGLIGLVSTGAVAAVVIVLRRREDDEVEPEPEPQAVPAYVAPVPVYPIWPAVPAPADRGKTIAISRNDLDGDDVPLVAWIVPVDGPSAYQTFRLGDRTKIGAGSDCDVRIEDPHMSRLHAEIVLEKDSYIIIDRDSRNGVVFLDNRVAKHTLIDNDLFTCGTTSFKFKSTH